MLSYGICFYNFSSFSNILIYGLMLCRNRCLYRYKYNYRQHSTVRSSFQSYSRINNKIPNRTLLPTLMLSRSCCCCFANITIFLWRSILCGGCFFIISSFKLPGDDGNTFCFYFLFLHIIYLYVSMCIYIYNCNNIV